MVFVFNSATAPLAADGAIPSPGHPPGPPRHPRDARGAPLTPPGHPGTTVLPASSDAARDVEARPLPAAAGAPCRVVSGDPRPCSRAHGGSQTPRGAGGKPGPFTIFIPLSYSEAAPCASPAAPEPGSPRQVRDAGLGRGPGVCPCHLAGAVLHPPAPRERGGPRGPQDQEGGWDHPATCHRPAPPERRVRGPGELHGAH